MNKPHEVIWTKEKAALFWNYCGSLYHKPSFAKRFGEVLVGFVEKRLPIKGPVLDYGCGAGFLIERLLDRKISCMGIDTSEKALSMATERFKGNPFFKGVFPADLPLGLKTESVNTVFLVETIEHITPDQFDFTLKEIYRIIRPGGYLVVECHNEEPINCGKIICPDCGAVFHRIGHLRSFSPDTLTKLMQAYGFQKEFCWTTTLRTKTFMNRIRALLYFLKEISGQKGRKPNLIYIGKKYKYEENRVLSS